MSVTLTQIRTSLTYTDTHTYIYICHIHIYIYIIYMFTHFKCHTPVVKCYIWFFPGFSM